MRQSGDGEDVCLIFRGEFDALIGNPVSPSSIICHPHSSKHHCKFVRAFSIFSTCISNGGCDLRKASAFSSYVIYLITAMAASRSFCVAWIRLGTCRSVPEWRAFVWWPLLWLVRAPEKWVLGGFCTADETQPSAPFLHFYHLPSPLLCFAVLGIMQGLCNILKLIKASKTPCLIIHHGKRVASTIQTALWCCPVG